MPNANLCKSESKAPCETGDEVSGAKALALVSIFYGGGKDIFCGAGRASLRY